MSGFVLSPEASSDLESILEYIATDSLQSALQVLDRFQEVFQLLGEHPDAGHFRADLTSRPVRIFPVCSYIVVYTSGSRPVEIARILGAAQDVEALLKKPEKD